MATKGTFESRLDEVFGALSSSSSVAAAAGGGAPAWSVSSSQVERRQWRNSEADSDDDDLVRPTPEARPEDEQDEEDEEDGVRPKRSRGGDGDEELMDVQNMVGMDTALDSEDEEDQYDQVAMCKKSSEKLYMKEFGEDTDYFDKLPGNLGELKRMPRDIRASREGAASRLAEDAKEAEMNGTAGLFKTKRGLDPRVGSENISAWLKPEGKRKDDQTGSAGEEKRVKFADGTKAAAPAQPLDANNTRPTSAEVDRYKNVPDHVRHPDKYTYYYLDWSEEEGGTKANDAAFRETMEAVKRKVGPMEAAPAELPKSVPFVPRKTSSKKPEEAEALGRSSSAQAGVASMAAGEDEVCVVDDSCVTPRTASRSYRARNRPRDEDD